MNLSSEGALNIIALILYFGIPIVILLLIWIGVTLKGIKKKLDNK